MKKLRVLPVALIACVMLLALGGGGLAAGGNQAAQPAKSDKVVLNIASTWVPADAEGWGKLVLDTIDKFKAKYPNVTVNNDSSSHEDYENVRMKLMATTNTFPTMFMLLNSLIPAFAQQGMLMNWDATLNADQNWKNSFLNIWDEAKYKDSVYGIPYQFIVNQLMFYNKDMLASVGYNSFPVYWDDFLTLCQKLKDKGLIPIAMGDQDAWPIPSHFAEILAEYCCGPDWVKGNAQLQAKYGFDNPDFLKAVKMIEELVKRGFFNNDIASIGHGTEDVAYLYTEKAAIHPNGPWQIGGIVNDCPPAVLAKIDVAPFPAPRDAKSNVKTGLFTGGSGWEYCCNTKSTDAEYQAAINLIKMLTGAEYSARFTELGSIPVIKAEYVGTYDQSRVPDLTKKFMALLAKCPEFPPMNQQRTDPTVADVFYKKFQELVAGMSTAEQVVADIQAAYARVAK